MGKNLGAFVAFLAAFYAVTTGSFDTYTLMIWGVIPLVLVAAWVTEIKNADRHLKNSLSAHKRR